jgi:hypothetical protein
VLLALVKQDGGATTALKKIHDLISGLRCGKPKETSRKLFTNDKPE